MSENYCGVIYRFACICIIRHLEWYLLHGHFGYATVVTITSLIYTKNDCATFCEDYLIEMFR
jgi:hypothetical protein